MNIVPSYILLTLHIYCPYCGYRSFTYLTNINRLIPGSTIKIKCNICGKKSKHKAKYKKRRRSNWK